MLLAVGLCSRLNTSPNIDADLSKTPPISFVEPNEVVNTNKKSANETNEIPEPKTNNYDREKGDIKNTIRLASNLEIEALRTVNPSILQKVMTGDALRNCNATLDQFRTIIR